MATFCTDIDLLHWEPAIFREALLASQTLLDATADVSGTTVTLVAPASFASSNVSAGHAIVLAGDINGTFPILEVGSPTQATISVLYDGVRPAPGEGAPVPSPPEGATAVPCTVRTFWAQRSVVGELMLQLLGLAPDQAARVLNPSALKRASVLGTLNMIYGTLAAAATDPAPFEARHRLYERLFRRAMRTARVEIDLDDDGRADCARTLSVVNLRRA